LTKFTIDSLGLANPIYTIISMVKRSSTTLNGLALR